MSRAPANPGRVLRPFKLLRNYAEYKRWSNSDSGKYSSWNCLPRGESQRNNLERCQPARYPCLAYVEVTDMQCEKSEPFYLYADTLDALVSQIAGAI